MLQRNSSRSNLFFTFLVQEKMHVQDSVAKLFLGTSCSFHLYIMLSLIPRDIFSSL